MLSNITSKLPVCRDAAPYSREYRLSHRQVYMKKSCLYEGVMCLVISHVISKRFDTFLQGRRPHILMSTD